LWRRNHAYYHSTVALASYAFAPRSEGDTDDFRFEQLTQLHKLCDSHVFGPDLPFDCVQGEDKDLTFGIEDPRLLSLPLSIGREAQPLVDAMATKTAEPWLLFHSHAHFALPGVRCASIGDTSVDGSVVEREQGLQPYLVPLSVDADGGVTAERSRLVQLHAAPVRPEDGTALTMGAIEKNWSPFVHGDELYAVYEVAPRHTVVAIDVPTGEVRPAHTTDNRACVTNNSTGTGTAAAAAAAGGDKARAAGGDQGGGICIADGGFVAKLHGGGGVVHIEADPANGIPEAHYLSTMHTINSNYEYTSYLYQFRAEAPFDVLSVSKEPLPMQASYNSWNGLVAFTSSVSLAAAADGSRTLYFAYGTGDRDSRMVSLPLSDYAKLQFRAVAAPSP